MDTDVTRVIRTAEKQIADQAAANRFVERLESGLLPRDALHRLAGELYPLVLGDRRSFALLASRFPAAPAGDLYLAMADGEGQALSLLLDFAAALGLSEEQLRAHEPAPLAQAYPAYLAQTSLYGTRSDVALALLANAGESGETSARIADALQSGYGFDDAAVGHFRFFADTPPALLEQARATLAAGLAAGDDPVSAVRTARMVNSYETMFYDAIGDH